MKQKRIIGLGLVMVMLTCWLTFFAVSSYPQIKAIGEREQYLESLSWYVPLSENTRFSSLGYGCQNKIILNYPGSSTLQGMVTPEGMEIVPCIYQHIEYTGGNYFAAMSDDAWFVFDFQGKQIAKINREDGHLYYAGDKYFIRYPDFQKMGFEIIDGETGQVVRTFDDCYSCVRLLNGNWYISKTLDDVHHDRQVLNERQEWIFGYEYFEATEVWEGFFVDENFDVLYDGQTYQLVIAGDGYCIANRIEDSKVRACVCLDENGEIFVIPPSALKVQAEASSMVNPVYGLFVDGKGNIGIMGERDSENHEGAITYYNQVGDYVREVEPSKDLLVFYDEEGLYQLRDREMNVLLEPWFDHIEPCGDGSSAEVIVDGRSGIVNLKAVI